MGALAAHMFAVGLIEDGSSSVPSRTTVSAGRPVLSANKWLPHFGQNLRRRWLPLSATLMYSLGLPSISIDAVEKIALIMDRETGRPRGFAFVEMSQADASRAMQSLNGTDFGGRALKVNEAQERPARGA